MPRSFRVEIATVERLVFSDEVTSLILPAHDGYMGVWAGHAPIAVALQPGAIQVTEASGERSSFAVSGGFARVSGYSVAVMGDAAERADEIDTDRAAAARDRALQRLRSHEAGIDIERARAALLRALTRLKVAAHRRAS
jgi:F-type H+-transporting ATPase subunit epsilon